MNNLSEKRKEFATVYGIPGCNCKSQRADSFLNKLKPLLLFLIADAFFTGVMVTVALIQYFPKMFKFYNIFEAVILIALVIGIYLLWRIAKKHEADMQSYDIGIEGENAVATEMTFLPQEYVVFHSVNLPDCKWDIDHIVLSPYGIILIETKKWNTPMEYKDGRLVYDRNTYPKDPLKQLKDQAMALKGYLEKIPGIEKLWIQGVLCLVGQKLEGVPEAQIDKCYVTNEKWLYDLIVNYNLHRISDKDQGLIEGKLSELCKK